MYVLISSRYILVIIIGPPFQIPCPPYCTCMYQRSSPKSCAGPGHISSLQTHTTNMLAADPTFPRHHHHATRGGGILSSETQAADDYLSSDIWWLSTLSTPVYGRTCAHVSPAWPRSVERVVPRNFNVVEHGFVTHNIGTYGAFNRYLR